MKDCHASLNLSCAPTPTYRVDDVTTHQLSWYPGSQGLSLTKRFKLTWSFPANFQPGILCVICVFSFLVAVAPGHESAEQLVLSLEGGWTWYCMPVFRIRRFKYCNLLLNTAMLHVLSVRTHSLTLLLCGSSKKFWSTHPPNPQLLELGLTWNLCCATLCWKRPSWPCPSPHFPVC